MTVCSVNFTAVERNYKVKDFMGKLRLSEHLMRFQEGEFPIKEDSLTLWGKLFSEIDFKQPQVGLTW